MQELLLRMKKARDKVVNSGKEELSYYYLHFFDKEYNAILQEERLKKTVKRKQPGKRGRQGKGKIGALIERLSEYKASGCFRTIDGAEAFAKIMSYIGIVNKLGYNSLIAVKSSYESIGVYFRIGSTE